MIDWKKSAELNNMSVDELKEYFVRFPSSTKRIIAICEGKNCKNNNKGRKIQFNAYSNLCKSCSNTETWKDKITREKRIKHITKAAVERWSDPKEHEKASNYWMGKRTGEDNHNYGNKCTDKTKDKIRDSMPDMSGDKSVHYKPEIDKWIEENTNKHICECGCGEYIVILRSYYNTGIPKYKYKHGQRSNLNGRWNGGKIKCICLMCGFEYEVNLYRENTTKFCSNECFGNWKSKNKSGENSPNWQGGISFDPYCEKFNPAKKKEVRDKYDNCDYLTGIHRDICNKDKNGKIRELDVHHFDYNKMQGCDDHEWKLIPVTRRHNTMFNNNRSFWKRLIEYSLEYDKNYYKDEKLDIKILLNKL